ncbi:solute carrier family 25 member 39 isoform X2 [Vombatus ursinus]|uniref:solute carrier family 25 member 39 isoform X2 n=1 Tax=Vombatus ursinus TaxID=29139 RepID=UPI000FFD624A|nr:solute carrier family 25 member 39 isoform X2 [Vombatus ursinus]
MAEKAPGGISPLQQMVASGTGGLVTSIFMTPLDVVKVRLQSQRPSPTSGLAQSQGSWSIPYTKWKCMIYCNGILEPLYLCQNGSRCAVWYQQPTYFTGTMDAFVKITRHEGARTLWSGLPATLVMTVPATAIYFTTYDQLKAFLCSRAVTSDLCAPMVAGAMARPLYWFNYELVKTWLCKMAAKDRTSVSISFVAGAFSGTVAAVLTLPFDVVKTQRQMELGSVGALRVTSPRSPSTWLLLRRIQAESGARGLFAGFLPRIIKAAPSCAIMISTYEFSKNFFQRLNLENCPRGP